MPDVVVGIDSDSYTPGPGDVGASLYCRVTATNAAGSAAANSNTVGPVVTAPVVSGPATANLWLWLKADAGVFQDSALTTPATTTGHSVAGWQDQSPAGTRHYTQATDVLLTPHLYLGGAFPVVRFSHLGGDLGGGPLGEHLNGPDMSGLTAGEIFIVVKTAAYPSGGSAGGSFWSNSTGGDSLYPYSDGNIYESWGSITRAGPLTPGVPLNVFRLYNVVMTAANALIFLDGTNIYTYTASSAVGFGSVSKLGRAENPGAGNTFSGDIAEVVQYSAQCSAPDKATTKAYLATKYSLTVA